MKEWDKVKIKSSCFDAKRGYIMKEWDDWDYLVVRENPMYMWWHKEEELDVIF